MLFKVLVFLQHEKVIGAGEEKGLEFLVDPHVSV